MLTVIERYQQLGIRMTLRQLFYQLVAADIIPNNDKYYKKISEVLGRARMAGLVDWNAIEDRTRVPYKHAEWSSLRGLMDSAEASFRLQRHDGQENYIEIWTEKDAISSVLRPICDEYHVRISVNRGYSSVSAMYDAYNRFQRAVDNNLEPVLLYLGDHDASGLDMDRDIPARLSEFGVDVDFNRVGLTQEHIHQYNPPPNPAKLTDPRAREYIARFGRQSWEVDALPPEVLNRIVTEAITSRMDLDSYNRIIEIEDLMRPRILEAGDGMDDEFEDELEEIEDMRRSVE